MLKRDINRKLIEWKNRDHHPLILSGLRQTGKTFSVKEFGKENYKSVVYIDFRNEKKLHQVFDGDFDVNMMVMGISALRNDVRFIEHETLLIFDEIQDCPNARSSLKYWDIDGRYDVIATGSFLSVKGFRKPYVRGVPVGYEEHMHMYPLTFREFAMNMGLADNVWNYVSDCIERTKHVDEAVHSGMRRLYLQYLIVGGMPEAVNAFLKNTDINHIRQIQRSVIDSLKADFGRYLDSNNKEKINETIKLRAEACLNSLPGQLSKEYKKFQYSMVNLKANSPEKLDGVTYLEDVGLLIRAYNVCELSAPLEGVKKSNEYKAYFCDNGLLMAMLESETAWNVLNGDLSAYKGAIAENMVAATFNSLDKPVYYYREASGSPELDFVFNDQGNISIIECKSVNNKCTSMRYVLSKPEKYGEHKGIKIADSNIGECDAFVTYPLYALSFLLDKERPLALERVTFDMQ